jgi:DNA-binding NarL/FixJ family response regulator
MVALATRTRVAIAQDDLEQADRDAKEALTIASGNAAYLTVPDVLECLAEMSAKTGSRDAARMLGAAQAIRTHTGQVRFAIHDADYHATADTVRNALSVSEFESAWAEGSALSTQETIAYALRGRGPRKRPSSGWAALTPTELEVAHLVCQGLSNKEIGARSFISPRTVQTHLTHIYNKLKLTSRAQLAYEAARRFERLE